MAHSLTPYWRSEKRWACQISESIVQKSTQADMGWLFAA